jgi:hypothetical protein
MGFFFSLWRDQSLKIWGMPANMKALCAGMQSIFTIQFSKSAPRRHTPRMRYPVRRALSIPSSASLEYWITRMRG